MPQAGEDDMLRALWANSHFWESPIRIGAHHYARLLAEAGWRVGFCSDPISPLHFLKRSTLADTRKRFATWRRGGDMHLGRHLATYTPLTLLPHHDLPLLRSRWLLDGWGQLCVPRLARWARRMDLMEPDLLVIDSVAQSLWRHVVKPRKTVLRVVDELSGFRGVSPAMLERQQELIAQVDLVVYTAHRLGESIAKHGPRQALYLPNGVDYRHFARHDYFLPPDLAAIPAPRAIYVGAIDDWFDVEKLAAAAEALPHVSFVIIGPPRINVAALAERNNVYLLGPRPYDELPHYVAQASVGLIPFQVTDMVRSVHPIKLYEYLACGIPVVASHWDELARLGSPAVLYESTDDFVDAVRLAISSPGDAMKRREFARQADWGNRLERTLMALGFPARENR